MSFDFIDTENVLFSPSSQRIPYPRSSSLGRNPSNPITKTRLFILKISPPKTESFPIKNSNIYLIPVQNIDCGYSLEPPRRGGSNEYSQSKFLSKNKKNNVLPYKPQFYCIKGGIGAQNYVGMFSWCKAKLQSNTCSIIRAIRFDMLHDQVWKTCHFNPPFPPARPKDRIKLLSCSYNPHNTS